MVIQNCRKNTVFAVAAFLLLACSSEAAHSKGKGAEPDVTVSPYFDGSVYNRFAIYIENRSTSRLDDGMIRTIDDEFTRAAMKLGYAVATRSDMAAIENELKIQSSDFTESAMAKRARALNVPAIILVTFISLDIEQSDSVSDNFFKLRNGKRPYYANVSLSARMIDAEQAQVIWISSISDSKKVKDQIKSATSKVIARAARKVAGTLPAR